MLLKGRGKQLSEGTLSPPLKGGIENGKSF